jgi:hypothetical protein
MVERLLERCIGAGEGCYDGDNAEEKELVY